VRVAEHPPREVVHAAAVARDERRERVALAREDARDDGRVVGGRAGVVG